MASEITPLVSRKGDEDIDLMPNGAEADEFNPRPVFGRRNGPSPPSSTGGLHNRHKMKQPSVGGGFIDYVVDSWKPSFALPPPLGPPGGGSASGGIGTLLIPRKVPVKVEPKVHLANERTFLAWLSIITILTGASGLILAYGDNGHIAAQLYGLVLLPVSVAFLFYTLWKCESPLRCLLCRPSSFVLSNWSFQIHNFPLDVRRSQMIKNRQPGPFIDYVGPVTITTILMATIVAQFMLKLHSFHQKKWKAWINLRHRRVDLFSLAIMRSLSGNQQVWGGKHGRR